MRWALKAIGKARKLLGFLCLACVLELAVDWACSSVRVEIVAIFGSGYCMHASDVGDLVVVVVLSRLVVAPHISPYPRHDTSGAMSGSECVEVSALALALGD